MLDINIIKNFKHVNLNFQFTTSRLRTVVLGPSGSGKSSLLKMMAGFYHPDSGYLKFNDNQLFNRAFKMALPSHKRNFGYLPQEYTLFPHLNVRQNILYGMNAHKIAFDAEKFDFVIKKTGIDTKLNEPPSNLSGGQQQRVALARILMMNPTLLLLDEPFSALDVAIRQCLRDLLIDITDELNLPALFVTHDLEEAFIFAQELVVMDKGAILEYGERDALFARPRFAETAKLLDVKNIIPIQGRSAAGFEIGGEHIACNDDFGTQGEFLCIRPENIMILRKDKPLGHNMEQNVISGTAKSIHSHGRSVHVQFVAANNNLELLINVPEYAFNKLKLQKSESISIALRKESLFLCKRKDFAK